MRRKPLIAIFVVAVALAVSLAPPAGAQGAGVIEGRVVQGTAGEEEIGRTPLLLQKWRGETGEEGVPDTALSLESEKLSATDGQGFFRFEGLEADPAVRYVVQAGYREIAYRSGPIRIENGLGSAEVSVFETTDSDQLVSIRRASVALPSVDEESGLLGVLEIISFRNAGDRTFVGDLLSNPEDGGVVRIPLPPNAVEVNLGHGFGPDGFSTFDGGVINKAPLLPGESEMIVAYAVPYIETTAGLEKRYFYRVDNVTVLIPERVGLVVSPHLDEVGLVDIEGTPNILLTGEGLRAGESFRLTVSELPRFASAGGGGVAFDTALRGAAIGMMAVVAVGAMLYGYRRRGRRVVEAGAAVAEAGALEREHGDLVTSIAQLDDDYEAGLISKESHELARYGRKRRLVDVLLLLREQPAGPAS